MTGTVFPKAFILVIQIQGLLDSYEGSVSQGSQTPQTCWGFPISLSVVAELEPTAPGPEFYL